MFDDVEATGFTATAKITLEKFRAGETEPYETLVIEEDGLTISDMQERMRMTLPPASLDSPGEWSS